MATFGGGASHGPSPRAGVLSFLHPSQPRGRGGHSHLLRAKARAGPGVDKSHCRSQKPSLQVQLGAATEGQGLAPGCLSHVAMPLPMAAPTGPAHLGGDTAHTGLVS